MAERSADCRRDSHLSGGPPQGATQRRNALVWKLDGLRRIFATSSIDRRSYEAQHQPEGVGRRGASIDTSTGNVRLVFGIFAALAEFEQALRIGRQSGTVSRSGTWPERRSAIQDDAG